MSIRPLPPVPTRDDPANFALKGDAFLAALPEFRNDCNALIQSLQLVATTGTSTSSLTVGLGSKSLTTEPGKAWATGAWLYVFAAAAVSNYMVGRVTSYDVDTGALVVNVSAIDGSGTHGAWIIGLATPAADGHLLPRDGSRAMTGALTLPGNAANALEAVPKQQVEAIADAAASGAVADRMRVSLAASQPTTSGTAVDFTGIPAWAKRITVQLVGVSCAGGGYVGVRLGTGVTPAYATSGYLGCAWQVASFLNFTDLAAGSAHNAAGDVRHGSIVLTRQAGNTWVASSVVGVSNAASVGGGVSSITLGDALTAVRLTTHNGDTFDAGSVSILIEG